MGIEDLVDALQEAYLEFSPEKDTSQTAYRLANALYSKCEFTLPNKETKNGISLNQMYKRLVIQFMNECKLYERGELDYETFEAEFGDFLRQFVHMKSLAGFRMNRREKPDYSSKMKADVEEDLREEQESGDDYDETADA